MLKFSDFRYHGNRGRLNVNFNDTSELLDLENPLFGATSMALSLILAEFSPVLLKFSNFRCHGNRGHSTVNFRYTVKLLDPKKPLVGATSLVFSEF